MAALPNMPPSTYNIADLPWNTQDPPKERNNLFDSASSISSRRSSDAPPSTVFRGQRIIVLASLLSASATLLLTGIALYIFVAHESAQRGAWIVTAAPLGSILAIAFILAVFFVLTVPWLLRLLAYSLAWSWLRASVDNGQNRPTPFQLGIVVSAVHGANFSSLWAGLKYLHGFGKDKRTSYKPPILRRAVGMLAFALGLAYTCVILVVALAISSTSTSFVQLTDYAGAWPQLSRQVNSSMCATTSGLIASGINLCGLQTATTRPFANSLPDGLSTLTNNSAMNAVAFTNDGTAIIVPASIPQDVAYYGTSNGVYSECRSVTPQCISDNSQSDASNALAISCPASVGFNAAFNSAVNDYPFGILDATGTVMTSTYLVGSNPFQFGAVVQSQAYSSDENSFVGNTGFFTHGISALNVLTCDVTVRSVGYSYFNGTFTLDPLTSYTTTDLDIVRGIGAMTSAASLSDRVPAAIEGAGASDSSSAVYASAFALELSRSLIAFTSHLYAPSTPSEVQSVTPILGTRLSIPILALLLACIALYVLLVLALAIAAVGAVNASPYTLLATRRLSTPLAAVHGAYARVEAHRTWELETNKLFSVETGLDRLSVGPTTTRGGGLAFGITRSVAVGPSQGMQA
ncbi:hypothetical protein MKEN_00058900 [Mycena kentingensis (nom. inval.)]|nr:hypothetical protein MKEN_00058900 [Mycena kentingensis (nom. inval.)]